MPDDDDDRPVARRSLDCGKRRLAELLRDMERRVAALEARASGPRASAQAPEFAAQDRRSSARPQP